MSSDVEYTQYHVADNSVRDVFQGTTAEPDKAKEFIELASGEAYLWSTGNAKYKPNWYKYKPVVRRGNETDYAWFSISEDEVPKIIRMYRLITTR